MSFLKNIFRKEETEPARTIDSAALWNIQKKFRNFHAILDNNSESLRIMSDMEEKTHGDYLFDMNYIEKSLVDLRNCVQDILENLMLLGGEEYYSLVEKTREINEEVEHLLKNQYLIPKSDFTINFFGLTHDKIDMIGSKNAQLSEVKTKLGIQTPAGFAITTWAYKHFLNENKVDELIMNKLRDVDIKNYEDLVKVSSEIRQAISKTKVPDDLAEAIKNSYSELIQNTGDEMVSMRSSALGEDSQLTFAGQYATYLNVKEEEVIDRYRDVIASKFTPRAIYYLLSHSLLKSELAMSVGCVEMIDAGKSGVIYTRDPVTPDDGTLLIHSIYGLGKHLVDGTITPDRIKVSRDNGKLIDIAISDKPDMLVTREDGGIEKVRLSNRLRKTLSLSNEEIGILTYLAHKIEEHYGKPLDIEWAIDREGEPFILQIRPLQVMNSRPGDAGSYDSGNLKKLASGGITVCPGGGIGRIYRVTSSSDFVDMPDNAVIVAPHTFPNMIAVMNKTSAIIAVEGSSASHTATIAREYRIPTIVGMHGVENLKDGEIVTVDATNKAIFKGTHSDILLAVKPDFDYFKDDPLFDILKKVLTKISPLNLINPNDPSFKPSNCITFHDILRYAHQKAMKEMFESAGKADSESIGIKMKSSIPLDVYIIYIDRDPAEIVAQKHVDENEIGSVPMEAFWLGVKEIGLPKCPKPDNPYAHISISATNKVTHTHKDFSKNSFAILGKEFMILSLKMGYHFSTVEAMCSDKISKNYIKLQFKEGGASLDRRARRIRLITTILDEMGFNNKGMEDFLDSSIINISKESAIEKVRMLGMLSILTKQLDMTLVNDSITNWYINEIRIKMGLPRKDIKKYNSENGAN